MRRNDEPHPGESALVHAHSISAVRFGLAGSGARMIIDGDRVPMEPDKLGLRAGFIRDASGLYQAQEEM